MSGSLVLSGGSMRALRSFPMAVVTAFAVLIAAGDASAFRMIQNTTPGRTSIGGSVTCTSVGGFVHWNRSQVEMRLNPANQGGEAGVPLALQHALASWTAVTPAGYQLSYGGTTATGFTTDGINTVLWATGNGCTGGCLALTALVIGPGQVLQEADVSFNDAFNWNTNGSDYDVEAIAAHEFGHCLGIHHTELTKPRNRPTMYTAYFGVDGRTLESDDRDALNCAFGRYPVAAMIADESASDAGEPEGGVSLLSRVHDGHATLRYRLHRPGDVRLDVFDIAGRRLTTLVSGARDSGEYEVAWGGETRSGIARRGVYFARLETPEGHDIATILLNP
jgi:hypothetical protein